MGLGILEQVLIVLIVALMVTVTFRYLKLPVILGFVVAGGLISPHAFGLMPDVEATEKVAEFGIVFLMFTVGLEFSLPKLNSMKFAVFVLGGLQVIIATVVTTIIAMYLGMTMWASIVVGGIVAMSSTSIVLKQLMMQKEINKRHGLNAVGILLFQDLAVIPFVILIASLTTTGVNLPGVLLFAFIKGIIAVIAILAVGRWILKPLFHVIAGAKSIELFTLMVLLVTLSAAWLTDTLGLSYALGAFLAGIMLSESEFRYQIEIEIRPIRDILLGLFFISIGMLLDVGAWADTWMWIALLLFALVIGKAVLVIVLCKLFGEDISTSFRTALVLAQGGEFGFAILSLALARNLLPPDYGQVVLSALILSIAISSIFISYNKQIAQFVFPPKEKKRRQSKSLHLGVESQGLKDHVIICGFGRVGQSLAHFLHRQGIQYVGLDLDPVAVKNSRLAGDNVIYGDATHPSLLRSAGINRARALVLSFDDVSQAIKILDRLDKDLPLQVLVRAKDELEQVRLKEHGADFIVTEIFEESLTMAHHLLKVLGVSREHIFKLFHDVRAEYYESLRTIFPSEYAQSLAEDLTLQEDTQLIVLPKDAAAIGKKIEELDLKSIGVSVLSVRRGEEMHFQPDPEFVLAANDSLIVYGNLESLEKAEEKLLHG